MGHEIGVAAESSVPRYAFNTATIMDDKISYQEILKDSRWIKRRNEILTRDKNTCRFCGAQDKYLHVHHKYYMKGRMPWEYSDDTLVTLCEDCHRLIHQSGNDLKGIKIGQIYIKYHSDYENICIVYNIDYEKELIFTLECDNGSAVDSIYNEINSFSFFNQKYTLYEYGLEENEWFCIWLAHISENLENTPMPFRYRWSEILRNNKQLVELINKQ